VSESIGREIVQNEIHKLIAAVTMYIETSLVPVRYPKAAWIPSGYIMFFFPILPLPLILPYYILYYPFNPQFCPF